jgi:hypothetical protein
VVPCAGSACCPADVGMPSATAGEVGVTTTAADMFTPPANWLPVPKVMLLVVWLFELDGPPSAACCAAKGR